MTDTVRRSWLIQRLNQPGGSSSLLSKAGESLAFGGGLRNGGLSPEAMNLLRDIFAFDYMGSAEFEFGAVPKALDAIAKDHKQLVWREVVIDLSTLAPAWRDDSKHEGERSVWVICRKAHVDEVEGRIRAWASEGYASRLKETTNLSRALSPTREDYDRTDGWLEIDNGFFFFTDRSMFEGTADLFGVTVKAAVK